MKKITAIVGLICLVLMVFGYHFVFHLHLQEIKSEMKEHLHQLKNRTELIKLGFSKEELTALQWEDDHEFKLDGLLYDVLKKEKNGNKTIIYCVQDKKETALLDAYQKIQHKNNADKNSSAHLYKLITVPFICSQQIQIFSYPSYIVTDYFSHGCQLPVAYLTIVTPPPQSV